MPNFIHKIVSLYIGSLALLLSSIANVSSISDLELIKIIDQQDKLLKEGKNWTEEELTRQAQEIVTSYENFLLDNPDNINALLLFGKFLRKAGMNESAVSLFLKADQINPHISVIKQELGNFLVETGKPVDAFPFFLMATRLTPQEPVYHFNLGNFIFLFEKELAQLEDSSKLGVLMHESFKEAAKLSPKNFDYHLRFAQSFFDFENSLEQEALIAWEILASEFGVRSQREEDYIKVSKAKILLEMGENKKAINLLRSVKSKSMNKETEILLKKALTDNDREIKKSSLNRNPYNSISPASSHFFPTDPNLQRMKVVTLKLFQEQMLEELHRDVIKATMLPNGELTLEFSKRTQEQIDLNRYRQ